MAPIPCLVARLYPEGVVRPGAKAQDLGARRRAVDQGVRNIINKEAVLRNGHVVLGRGPGEGHARGGDLSGR